MTRSTSYQPKGVDAEALRKESLRREREVVADRIPELSSTKTDTSGLEKREERFTKELQEVKAQLATVSTELADLRKKAEVTDQEPEARSVDPLRKRSEELALEVSSGGMSLRKPPEVKATPSEPVDLDALKRESHDLMFEVLSYSTE